jgi:hypothetical protein
VRQALVEKGFCSQKIDAQLVKRRRLTACLHETSLSASKLLADTAATYAALCCCTAAESILFPESFEPNEPVGGLGMSVLRQRRGTGPAVRILLRSLLFLLFVLCGL